MIAFAEKNHVPLDFVSTHVYGDDSAKDVFHDDRAIAPHQMVCQAVKKVHEEIERSSRPTIPLIWSETNATYANHQEITDSIYMGPWLAHTISQCDGMVNMMSYWTFSDVFEEQGVVKTPFYGGYGLVAEDDIPKPAFDAFALLHELGDERLPVQSSDVLATRRKDGTLEIAAWNLVEPDAAGGEQDHHLRLEERRCQRPRNLSPRGCFPRRHAERLEEDGEPGKPDQGSNRSAAKGLRTGTAGESGDPRAETHTRDSSHGVGCGGDSLSCTKSGSWQPG